MNLEFKIFKYAVRTSVLAIFIGVLSCVEPYEIEETKLENALVVEATITNELKRQEVNLSRAYNLTTDTIKAESSARVYVVDDAQNQFEFVEESPGKYVSLEEFAANANRRYHLEITTTDGRAYQSEEKVLNRNSDISDLYAERRTGNSGEEGVAILVNSGNSDDTGYYKYTFEETYKIVSPFTQNKDLVVDGESFRLVDKTKEEEICYNTIASNDIILANTRGLQQNNLQGQLIKFMGKENKKIFFRYSIKVRQLALSPEAYSYYNTLNDLSGSESPFSQNQPGFLQGNIFAEDDPEENVVGFFNVAGVSSKRIFFDYTDLFDITERPDLKEDCEILRPKTFMPNELKYYVLNNQVKYLADVSGKPADEEGEGPYRVVLTPCMDCTVFGTNVKPEFWIE